MTKIVFTCDCGKTVRIDKCHAGRRGRCPYCKAMIDIPAAGAATTEAVGGPQKQAAARRASTMADVDAPVSVERSLAPRMRANRLIAGKLCTICQTKIDAGEEVRNCTRCHSSFHVSCWDEVGGCGTYGCEEAPGATSSSGSASATGAGTSQPKAPSPEQLTKGASTMAAPAGRRCRPHGYRAVSAAVLVGLVAIIALVFFVTRNSGLRALLDQCSSRHGVQVHVYYESVFSKQDVVFDFQGVSGSSVRRIDPVHLLLQFGDKLDKSTTNRLILARNGRNLMYLRSSDLKELTREYTFGNPVWAFNHLPERLLTMSGANAYGRWEGGWLGVLEKQAEQLNTFIDDWTGF
ncbi:MAG: hypothetical protein KJ749_07075 [Planctomycetes bacterium]|nr:hypothetical protein [Planctomycetota bacterium]